MSSVKEAFGTSNQAITCTMDSLASAAARQSTAVDNSTNLYLDAFVALTIVSGATGVSATGSVAVYAYGTADGGANYSDGASGTDGAITLTNPPNMRFIGLVNVVASAATYHAGPFSVAAAFGGTLPDHWGIVVVNNTGAALGTGNAAIYQGIYSTVA